MNEYTKLSLELLAVLLSPFFAILATKYIDERKEAKAEKRRLFLSLMTNRHLKHLSVQFVEDIHRVPVVFYNQAEVRRHCEQYMNLALRGDSNEAANEFLNMLDGMAKYLDYGKLRQTDIANNYCPHSIHNRVLGEIAYYEDYLNESNKRRYPDTIPPAEAKQGTE